MTSGWRPFLLLLSLLFGIAACGQKGPLFLPGNPSQISPPPAEDESNDEREDEDGEQRG